MVNIEDSNFMTTNKIILEKIRFNIVHSTSRYFLDEMDLETYINITSDIISSRLKLFLIGNKIHTEEKDLVVNEYPATMWEELPDGDGEHETPGDENQTKTDMFRIISGCAQYGLDSIKLRKLINQI